MTKKQRNTIREAYNHYRDMEVIFKDRGDEEAVSVYRGKRLAIEILMLDLGIKMDYELVNFAGQNVLHYVLE